MKLNKLQRYTAYCIIQEDLLRYKMSCFCSIFINMSSRGQWKKLNTILPELFEKRTVTADSYLSYWFRSLEERKKAISQCIL